ncbi:hypothetical protein DFAR_2590017 [Desulfarculales bacterium]
MPNIIGILPGMTAMATSIMKGWLATVSVPNIPRVDGGGVGGRG